MGGAVVAVVGAVVVGGTVVVGGVLAAGRLAPSFSATCCMAGVWSLRLLRSKLQVILTSHSPCLMWIAEWNQSPAVPT